MLAAVLPQLRWFTHQQVLCLPISLRQVVESSGLAPVGEVLMVPDLLAAVPWVGQPGDIMAPVDMVERDLSESTTAAPHNCAFAPSALQPLPNFGAAVTPHNCTFALSALQLQISPQSQSLSKRPLRCVLHELT